MRNFADEVLDMADNTDVPPSWSMNKGYSSPEQSLFRFLEIHIFAAALPRILDIQISASQSQSTAATFLWTRQSPAKSRLRLLKVVTLLSCWTANFQRNINFNWASTWKTKNHLEFCWTGFDSKANFRVLHNSTISPESYYMFLWWRFMKHLFEQTNAELFRLFLHEATMRLMAGASPNKTQELLNRSRDSRVRVTNRWVSPLSISSWWDTVN